MFKLYKLFQGVLITEKHLERDKKALQNQLDSGKVKTEVFWLYLREKGYVPTLFSMISGFMSKFLHVVIY